MYLAPPPSSRILDSAAAEGAGETEMVRGYEAWKGSNVFFLQGRLIFGPDVRSVPLTVFLIVAPVVVFCVFVARKLMDDFPHNWGISIIVVAVVFTLYVIILLLLTSGRDPGIIPRNLYPPEQEVSIGASETPQLRMPRTKDVVVNGINVKIKYCDTCMLYRPPRCSHCSICNNCVERFDHHCPWVGQCIGKRNYRFFFMFVSSTTVLCLYVFGFCWVYIMRIRESEEISIWRAMIKTPASIGLIVYTFICVWFVGGLSVFHLYLIGTNQSTYENFRYRYERHANPYNTGVTENFKEILCTSIPPSKNNFRAKVPKEPVIPPRSVGDGSVSPNISKIVGLTKMGRKPIQGSAGFSDYEGYLSNDDGNDKDSQLDITPDLSRTLPLNISVEDGSINSRHSSWGRSSGSWNIEPQVHDVEIEDNDLKQVNGSSNGNLTSNTRESHHQTTSKM